MARFSLKTSVQLISEKFLILENMINLLFCRKLHDMIKGTLMSVQDEATAGKWLT